MFLKSAKSVKCCQKGDKLSISAKVPKSAKKNAKKGHYISVSYIPENLQNIIIP